MAKTKDSGSSKRMMTFGAVAVLAILAISAILFLPKLMAKPEPAVATKLYWFIPDGMRADPSLINVYQWAQEGKLPNIKRMMDEGSYGYSIPVFPTHTPVNFAALLTGTKPLVNGVADGPMRVEGYPLATPSVGGFWSSAKRVAPIWTVLENDGKKVALLSIPGSTPPELKNGITIRGRWGNWGSDDAALVFMPTEMQANMSFVGKGFKLFYFGAALSLFVPESTTNQTVNGEITSYSPIRKAVMTAHGLPIYAFIIDSTDDGKTNYDEMAFSLGETTPAFSVVKQQQWTDWQPVTLKFQNASYSSEIKLSAIKIWDGGQFRVRVLYNNLNKFVTAPADVAADMTEKIGPMVDFVDNYPPQLIYEPEDRGTFLAEAQMSLDYHKNATDYVLDTYHPDVFIQDIYTPNQMLSSRWWMRYIDPASKDYSAGSALTLQSQAEVLKMYQGLDAILGEALKHDDGKTVFVLSSDHGMILQSRIIAFNNLFAQKGWLKFSIDNVTGETIIDWKNTKVLFLQTDNVYINPAGLAGNYTRASGPEYEALRNDVIAALQDMTDPSNGVKPISAAVKREDVPAFFDMPEDRVGDIVLEYAAGYGLTEAASYDGVIFSDSLTSGNKQAYDPNTNGLQTPFMMMGPGIKKGFALPSSISHIDQMPTILHEMNVSIPSYVQGRVVTEVFSNQA